MNIDETVEIEYSENSALAQIYRSTIKVYALLAFEFWSDGFKTVIGEIPENIKITKKAGTNSITITNNSASAIAVVII